MSKDHALVYSLLGPEKSERIKAELQRHSFLGGIGLSEPSGSWHVDVRHLTAFGVHPSAYESLFLSAERSTDLEVEIVLTNSKLDTEFRISEVREKRSYVISCWHLDERDFPANCVHLIFACAVRARFAHLHADGQPTACAADPLASYSLVPTALCLACRRALPFHGVLESRHINLIRTASPSSGQIVIIQHGIRTYASWYPSVMNAFGAAGVDCVGFRYGYFSAPMLFLIASLQKPLRGDSIMSIRTLVRGTLMRKSR